MSDEPDQEPEKALDKNLKNPANRFLVCWPFAVAALFTLALVYCYVAQEAPTYWSDFNYYEWAERLSLGQLIESPLTYPILILASVSFQHNFIFTVPLLATMAAFGDSRFAYIASTSLIYLLPLAYVIALIGRNVLSKPALSQAQAFFIVLLLPVLWAPCLRGYPDAGAALCLLTALLTYLQDRSFSSVKRAAMIGFLLALTVLMRRHLAYAGVALVVSIVLEQAYALFKARNNYNQNVTTGDAPTNNGESLVHPTMRIKTLVALILSGIFTMVCLGMPFLQNLTKLNYGVLYESYHVSTATALAYFFSCFGLLLVLVSLAGFFITWRNNQGHKSQIVFIIGFFLLAQILWIAGPNELGTHYTLYFSPLVALGMVLFFNALAQAPVAAQMRRAVIGGSLILLALNFCLSLAPKTWVDKTALVPFRPGMLSFADQEGHGPALLLSAGYAPYARGDVETLQHIVDLLRPHYLSNFVDAKASAKEHANDPNPLARRGHVCVASCGNTLNGDTLRNIERAMYGLRNDKISILEIPVADSKDCYPLEALLSCQYLLLPEQPEYFVAPAGQKILTSIKACFDEKWPLAGDFKALPGVYNLDGGMKVSIYERVRATAESTAALTLARMKAFVGKAPGSQPAWISTGLMSPICYDKNRHNWLFKPGLYRPGFFCEEDRYLLYTGDLPPKFTLNGILITAKDAPATTLRAQLIAEDGKILDEIPLAGPTAPGQSQQPFARDFGTLVVPGAVRPKYLALLIDNAAGAIFAGATQSVSNLTLEPR